MIIIITPLNQAVLYACKKKFGPNKSPGDWALDRVGTVHDLRYMVFDNDIPARIYRHFDGDRDAYINDFGSDC